MESTRDAEDASSRVTPGAIRAYLSQHWHFSFGDSLLPPPMLVTSQIGNPGTWLECHSLSWQDLDKPLPLSKAHWLFWQMRALD